MSIETWKSEFYPVDAADVPEAEAVAHSLRKWKGLRPEALKKHDLTLPILTHQFGIDDTTCALCQHYVMKLRSCNDCPLTRIEDGVECGEEDSPYSIFVGTDDPEPMIATLEESLRLVERERQAEEMTK